MHPPPVLRISLEACTENINQDPGPNHSTRTKTSDGSQSLKKSASGIQSLFRLHQSFSSGSIVTALEEVIKLEIQMSEACADDRFLVFCLRGLLQHAVSYIQRVDASAGVEIEKYEEEVGWGGKKARDAAQRSERISKLRWVARVSSLDVNVSFSNGLLLERYGLMPSNLSKTSDQRRISILTVHLTLQHLLQPFWKRFIQYRDLSKVCERLLHFQTGRFRPTSTKTPGLNLFSSIWLPGKELARRDRSVVEVVEVRAFCG